MRTLPVIVSSLVLASTPVLAAPTVDHSPVIAWVAGQPVDIEATVTADAEVAVELRLREDEAIEWLTLPMTDAGDGMFVGTIDAEYVHGDAFDYYLFAAEVDDPLQSVTNPLMAPDNHHTVDLDAGEDEASGCVAAGHLPGMPLWVCAVAGLALVRRRR